ncbi:MAG: hypothetical protein ACO3ND_01055 [Opitutales bacterium]
MRLPLPLVAILATAMLAGCKSSPPTELASVFIDNGPSAAPDNVQPVRLPVSEIPLFVSPRAVVMAERISAVSVVTAGDADLRQEYVMLVLDAASTQDIALLTRDAIGRSFVLVVGTEALGIMRIDRPIGDGRLFFHVEQKGMSNSQAAFSVAGKIGRMIEAVEKARKK